MRTRSITATAGAAWFASLMLVSPVASAQPDDEDPYDDGSPPDDGDYDDPGGPPPPRGDQPPPPPGGQPPPQGYGGEPEFGPRFGLMAEVSIGLGLTTFSTDEFSSETHAGLAGLNGSLGFFFSPQLAVFGRVVSNTFWDDYGFGSEQVISAAILVGAQYWVTPFIAAEAGIGVGIFGIANDFFEEESAVAIHARGTYRLPLNNGVQVSLDVTPGFYELGTVWNTSLLVGYELD